MDKKESTGQNILPSLKSGVEAIQMEHEGKPMILLRDQEGLAKKAISVSPPGFLVAMMLDGRTRVSDIQAAFTKQTGSLLKAEEINALVQQLDQSLLLETENLQAERARVLTEFKESSLRKAHHMEGGYPSQPLELATFLGKFFKDPKGPGKEMASVPVVSTPPMGLISPHIDFQRGGPGYAWAYQALSQSPPPDMIVALGVAHMSPNSPWILTPKQYETPYGPMEIQKDLYDQIQSKLWYNGTDDEWVHRTEHSLEFQALWLKYLWKEKAPPWVPLLCSSFEHYCPDKPPSTVDTVNKAIEDIGRILKDRMEKGQKILILAGVDLAHVGARFGDKEELNDALKAKIESEDRQSLEHVLKVEPDPFYMSVIKDSHWRKWCGLSALYTYLRLLKILSGEKITEGKLLTYDQAADPLGGVVSFVSAVHS